MKKNEKQARLTPAQKFAQTHPSLAQIVMSQKYLSILEDQENLKSEDNDL